MNIDNVTEVYTLACLLHDNFLVEHAIARVSKYYEDKGSTLFCIDALTVKGVEFKDKGTIRLLADEDILFTAKNCIKNDNLIDEYFSRNKRRHPVWKSEAEYYALFEETLGSALLDKFDEIMMDMTQFLKNNNFYAINENLISYCKEIIDKTSKETIPPKDKDTITKGYERIHQWAAIFLDYAKESGIECDFVVIRASKFKSNFIKNEKDINSLLVWFRDLKDPIKLSNIISMLLAPPRRDNFFYIFYRKPSEDYEINSVKLARCLKAALIQYEY